jgi:hypothetical protein
MAELIKVPFGVGLHIWLRIGNKPDGIPKVGPDSAALVFNKALFPTFDPLAGVGYDY